MLGADTASWLPLLPRSPCHWHFSHVHPQDSSCPCGGVGPCCWYSGGDAGGRGSPRKGLWILLPPSATWPFGPVFPGQTDARRGSCAVSLPLQAEGRNGSTPPQCSVHRWHSHSSLTDGFVVRRRLRRLCLVSHSWNVSLEQSSPEKCPLLLPRGQHCALRKLSHVHSGTESPWPWDTGLIIMASLLYSPSLSSSLPRLSNVIPI